MFFCPEVSLVKQQYEKMESLFEDEGYNIDYLIGSEVQDKPSIVEMIRTEQVRERERERETGGEGIRKGHCPPTDLHTHVFLL